jgi:hypothetical protein
MQLRDPGLISHAKKSGDLVHARSEPEHRFHATLRGGV